MTTPAATGSVEILSIDATGTECAAYTAHVPSWIATTLGRVYIAVTAVVLALLALNQLTLARIEDPSLGISLVRGSVPPLLVISVVLAGAARGQLIRRDRVALAVALTTAVTVSAAGVAVDQNHAAADALLEASGPLLGLTIVAIIWSALGRRST